MNKKLLTMAAAAMMFAACSDDSLQPEPIVVSKAPAVLGQTPIGFSAYTNKASTRAGAKGTLTTNGTTSLASEGFGVFGYYTDANYYLGDTKPDFMYNQKVAVNTAGEWAYEPVKYWPNEYGSNAESDDEDLVSFFAYAPYVPISDVAQGTVADTSFGIVGFTRNNQKGDPMVKYVTSFNANNQVDLSWGTVHTDSRVWKTLTGIDHNFTAGMPWVDVEHPANIDQKMKFNFQHALAQLNVQIDVDADEIVHVPNYNGPADGTKVYVRSITFEGFAQKGALNLNNTSANTPLWMNFNGQGKLSESKAESVTVSGSNLNSTIILNATEGVTGTLKNLFNVYAVTGDDAAKREAPVYLIPNGQPMTVTIVYNVETADDNLSGYLSDGTTHGSVVENKITKTVSFGGSNLRAGYNHKLILHLGLNSVKFDAEVKDWADATQSNVWLPENSGTGVYNPANPLTIMSSQGGATTVGLSGASATAFSIAGTGVDSAVKLSATGNATWTVSDPSVIKIAASTTPDAATRAVTDGDFAVGDWLESVDAQYIWIKPLNKGQATITSDLGGKISTIVITVDAPSITLTTTDRNSNTVSADAITLYLFSTPETATIGCTVNKASYETSNSETVTFESSDPSVATVDANTGVVTAVAAGTTTITATSSATGVTATSEVTVAEPTITAAVTDISLRQGVVNSVQLKFTMTPSDIAPVFTYNGKDTYYTFDESTYIVTQKDITTDDTNNIKVQFTGHTEVGDPSLTFTIKVQNADPGIALTESGSKVVGRVVVSDVAKTYASVSEAEAWGHTPIAVVAFTDALNYVDTDASNWTALAIGINDVGTTYHWQDNGTLGTNYSDTSLANLTAWSATSVANNALEDMAGKANYDVMVALSGTLASPAAQAVKNYSVSTPTGTSGWFIPSIGQWNKMIISLASSDEVVYANGDSNKASVGWDGSANLPRWTNRSDGYLAAAVNEKITQYGITGFQSTAYWSSTENSASTAWTVAFYNGTVINRSKWGNDRVRPVLAF